MNMDWGTAIIGAVSIVIGALPFVLIYRNRSKRRKILVEALTQLAIQHNRRLGEFEYCADFVLGFDSEFRYIFFYKQLKEKSIHKTIQLEAFQSCQVDKVVRTIQQGTEIVTLIEKVGLSFIPKKNTAKNEYVELFNEQVNIQLSGELQCAMKWSKEINGHLEKHKNGIV